MWRLFVVFLIAFVFSLVHASAHCEFSHSPGAIDAGAKLLLDKSAE